MKLRAIDKNLEQQNTKQNKKLAQSGHKATGLPKWKLKTKHDCNMLK